MDIVKRIKASLLLLRWKETPVGEFGYEFTTRSDSLRVHIEAVYADDKETSLQLIWFWIHPKFRRCGLGFKVLSKVIQDALQISTIKRIIVFPHPDPRLEKEEPMTVESLVHRYQRLGFRFINGHNPEDGMELAIRKTDIQ